MAYPLTSDQIVRQVIEEVAAFTDRNGFENPPEKEIRRVYHLCLAACREKLATALEEGLEDPTALIMMTDQDLEGGLREIPEIKVYERNRVGTLLLRVNLMAAMRVAKNMTMAHVHTVVLMMEFAQSEVYVFAIPKP